MRKLAQSTSPGKFKKNLLELLPDQGEWTEEQYLWLTDHTNRLVEFTDGCLEVLPMPTDRHQSIVEFLFLMFHTLLKPMGGKVHFAPLRLRIGPNKFREPDILLVRDARDPRRQNRFWTGADLVAEVVSEDKPERDLVQKRNEYAQAGILEYWIVNPQAETITVLTLRRKSYKEYSQVNRGGQVVSALFPDLNLQVNDVFDVE
jgi:Uma2 family endonuclease